MEVIIKEILNQIMESKLEIKSELNHVKTMMTEMSQKMGPLSGKVEILEGACRQAPLF